MLKTDGHTVLALILTAKEHAPKGGDITGIDSTVSSLHCCLTSFRDVIDFVAN